MSFEFTTRLLTKNTITITPHTARVTRNNKQFWFCLSESKMDTDALVSIIHSVSPSLAAYHYLRSTTSPSSPRCSKCGYLLDSTSHTRVLRLSSRKKQRSTPSSPTVHALQQTCATCGYVNNTLLQPVNHNSQLHYGHVTPRPSSASVPYPEAMPRTHGTDQPLLPDLPPVSTHLHSLSSLANAQPQLSTKPRKSRPKHKAGLQEVLARNRERQQEAANRSSSGLATFLHSL